MLNLYNTLTRKVEPFESKEDMHVKMYSCGPSTYQPAHIGNYRTFIYEDVLQRYLEYLGYKVTRLMTLTDVEDKAVEQAKKENLPIEELTSRNEAVFFKDFELLRIKKPDFPIRASTAVDQAVTLLEELVENGFAYWYTHKGARNVYFDPLKFQGFGKLAHLDMQKWPKRKRRFHKDTYPGTPWNLGDFVLWHGCQSDDVCYNTALGCGRPSWNIQDAAIVTKHLGFSVDLACGGVDNLVRHHDYTLAIAESVSGVEFSRFWLHGEHLLVNGEKMSKSLGNVYYPSGVVERGFSGEQLRFFLIYGHYRQKLNFTFQKLAENSRRLASLRSMVADLREVKPESQGAQQQALTGRITADFQRHMNNDFDVGSAFDNVYEIVGKLLEVRSALGSQDIKNALDALRRVDSVLQCLF